MEHRYDYDSRDPAAKKARKSVEQKHKSRRRHDEKDHLKRYVEDYNAGKRDIDYDNEDEN
jgi:patatin-like phospholipase/acyl hydrolase